MEKKIDRTIKFRAWDRELKMMHPNLEAGNGFINGYKDTLMQFTGLTDKNGKEIYEGDILRILNRRWSDYQNKYELLDEVVSPVVWDSEYAEFDCGKDEMWSKKEDVTEVIGNVWENPELLETKQND